MADIVPPDNLPAASMKWARWVVSTTTDNTRRIENLERAISNLNQTLLSTVGNLQNQINSL